MYYKIAINATLITLLVVAQVGFISGLPGWLKYLNIVLVALMFLLVLTSFELTFAWALSAGFLLDIYSFTFFGINIIALAISLIWANFLLQNFFTDRSLYTFIVLTIMASFSYKVILYSMSFLYLYILSGKSFDITSAMFWLAQLKSFAVDIISVGIVFYFLIFISKTLRPGFLLKR